MERVEQSLSFLAASKSGAVIRRLIRAGEQAALLAPLSMRAIGAVTSPSIAWLARSCDVPRSVGRSLWPACRPHRGSPHDAYFCQHSTPGRTRYASTCRAARPGQDHVSPWQSFGEAAARRRKPSQTRRTQSACRDRVARTRHRHRFGRSGLPARPNAFHRHVSTTVGRASTGAAGCRRAGSFR